MLILLSFLAVAFQDSIDSGPGHDMVDVNLTAPASGAVSNMHMTAPTVIMPEVLREETSELDDAVDYTPPATPTLRVETAPYTPTANWMLALSAGCIVMGLLAWQRVRRRMCAKS